MSCIMFLSCCVANTTPSAAPACPTSHAADVNRHGSRAATPKSRSKEQLQLGAISTEEVEEARVKLRKEEKEQNGGSSSDEAGKQSKWRVSRLSNGLSDAAERKMRARKGRRVERESGRRREGKEGRRGRGVGRGEGEVGERWRGREQEKERKREAGKEEEERSRLLLQ